MQLDKAQVLEATKKGKAERKKEELDYLRFREDHRKIPRGTVVLKNRVIWGFPHIPRIFTLDKGLEKNIKSKEIYLEEKIDGYNLRVAQINGKIFAFSRGGFIDLFSTEKARDLGLKKFFSDNPEFVLCGEMLGNTPYTKPKKKFDVRFFVFDIGKGDGSYLSCEDRYKFLRKYKIRSVPVFGKFKVNEKKKLANLAKSVNNSKSEGMVVKSADRKHVCKYVTPSADIEDISNSILFDMPSGFFLQRVFRSGMFIKDFNLNRRDYAKKLGEAFYSSFWTDMKNVADGRGAQQEFEILIKEPKIWENIQHHMSKEVKLEVVFRREEKERTRIRFTKTYKKTSKRLRDALNGKGETD
jgi:putative ATP-dependent DNA ligase